MVVALVALFVALGGGAYAVTTLPKSSVGNKQLKRNAVTSSKVKNHSLKSSDFKAGQLPAGLPGPKGATGPQGPKGDKGDKGDNGQNGQDLTATTTLPSGHTETGVYHVGSPSSGNYLVDAIQFRQPLAQAISNVEYVPTGTTTHCPARGQAAAGYLCLYSGSGGSVTFVGGYRPSDNTAQGADPDGSAIYFSSTTDGEYDRGTWAVTAP